MTPLDRFNAIREDTRLGAIEKLVAFTLATRADATGRAWPSYDRLARDTRLARGTVIRTIRALILKGLLRCERRRDESGDATSNAYVISVREVVSDDDQVVTHDDQVVSVDHHRSVSGSPQVVSHDDHGGDRAIPKHDHLTRPSEQTTEHLPLALPLHDANVDASVGGSKNDSQQSTLRSSTSKPGTRSRPRATKSTTKPDGYEDLVAYYCATYKRSRGVTADFGGRHGNAAKALLAKFPLDEVKAMVDRAFADAYFDGELFTLASKTNKYRGSTPTKANGHAKQPIGDDDGDRPEWLR